ncbi:MAG TPA: ATP-binding cassette domain-containing protein [Actinomycetota bacterium]
MSIEAAAGGAGRGPGGSVVRAQGAEVRFRDRVLWSDVELDILRGSFAAVLGPNGVGKSTLLKVLLGLQPLTAGRVEVLGAPAGRERRRIGYVPQRKSFDRTLRLRGIDVVRLGLDGARWGVPVPGRAGRQAHAAVAEAVRVVGAAGFAGRPIGDLSGGEQQRLVVAQALVRRPDLLLLDEPLDNLDLANQGAVAALVQRICRERGVTVVMVAHDVNPILPYLDQVVYLAAGHAVAGAPSDVIATETLSALYGAPVEVLRASDGRLVVVGAPEPPALHSDRHAR